MTQDILQSLCNEKFSLAQFSDFIHQSLQTEIYILSDSVNDPRREPLTKGFSKLKAYRKICDHIPLENDCKLGVFAFEVESLKAKVGLHTELKKFLDLTGGQ